MKTTGRALVVEARVGGADKSRFFFLPGHQKAAEQSARILGAGVASGEPRQSLKAGVAARCLTGGWSLEIARAGRDGSDSDGMGAGAAAPDHVAGSSLWKKKGHSSPVQFSRVVLAGSAAARARALRA